MNPQTEYPYQGKRHGGGCTGKAGFLMLMAFLLLAAIASKAINQKKEKLRELNT